MYDFFNGDASFVLLQGKVFKEAAPTQAAHPYPDPKVNILSTDLAKELRDYMDSHFIWEAGTWKIMASCQIQGRETNATATFVLSASDVQTMKNISKYYATGIGVGSNWRNLPTDDANPIKMVQLAQLKN